MLTKLKSHFYRSQSIPDTLETQNFPSPSFSQYALPANYILTDVGDKCDTCAAHKALQAQDKNKAIQVVCESGRLHSGRHNRSPLSEGQRGMTGVVKSLSRLMRLSSSSREPLLGPSQII